MVAAATCNDGGNLATKRRFLATVFVAPKMCFFRQQRNLDQNGDVGEIWKHRFKLNVRHQTGVVINQTEETVGQPIGQGLHLP